MGDLHGIHRKWRCQNCFEFDLRRMTIDFAKLELADEVMASVPLTKVAT